MNTSTALFPVLQILSRQLVNHMSRHSKIVNTSILTFAVFDTALFYDEVNAFHY